MPSFCNVTKVQGIVVIVERLRPFGHELKAEWLRSPGPDLVYKLIGLIQGSDLTYILHMIVQAHRTRAGSNRLTFNVIRNEQRNRRTLNETIVTSPQAVVY